MGEGEDVIPAPYHVRGKLQPESSVFFRVTKYSGPRFSPGRRIQCDFFTASLPAEGRGRGWVEIPHGSSFMARGCGYVGLCPRQGSPTNRTPSF